MILGLDPGQRRDPAGLAVLEAGWVRHLERAPLGTSYVALAERVAAVALAAGGCTVVVDATGARPFLDMLADRLPRSRLVAVTLTGGGRVHVRDGDPREVSLPRSALFLPLQAAVEAGRLRVADACPYAAELAQELLQARGGPSGAESRGAGHHGDLMTAVALALWWRGAAGLRPEQRAWRDLCAAVGWPWGLARSWDDALRAVTAWGWVQEMGRQG